MTTNYATLAAGAVIHSNDGYLDATPPQAIDLDDATYWAGNSITITSNYYGLDLGVPRTISSIRLLQSNTAGYCATTVRVDVGPDGANWSELGTYAVSMGDNVIDIPNTGSRWWRLQPVTGGSSRWRIHSLELLGADDQPNDPPSTSYATDLIDWAYWNYKDAINAWLYGKPLPEAVQIATLAMLCYLVAKIDEMATGGGGGTVDLTAVLDAIGPVGEGSLHDENMTTQTLLGTAYTAIGTGHADILWELQDPLGHLNIQEGNVEAKVTYEANRVIAAIPEAGGASLGDIQAAITASQNAVNGHTDDQADRVISEVNQNTDYEVSLVNPNTNSQSGIIQAALTAAVNGAVNGLTAEIDATEAAILAALAALPQDASGGYPGADKVTLGSTVRINGEGTVYATLSGVGGKMDGVLVHIISTPPRVTHREVENVVNHRWAGWLVFQDANGYSDQPQFTNAHQRVYCPMLMSNPAAIVCGFTKLVVADVTPWVVT